MPADTRSLDDELAGLDALATAAEREVSRARSAWRVTWPKLAAAAVFLAAWQLIASSGWKPDYVLASPADAFGYLGEIWSDGTLQEAILTTLRRASTGFGVAVVLGVVVGSLVARVRLLRLAVGSMITGIQTMPSVAWVPLALLLFQRDFELAMLFVMVLGATPSIANGIIGGVDHAPPILLRAGRVLGARGFSAYRYVVLPAAMPSFAAGLKQGWAFLWRSLMAAELIAGATGARSIGFMLDINRTNNKAAGVVAMMIIIFAIGVIVDALVFARLDKVIRKRWGLVDSAA